jgi:hypothetical protein
MDRCEPFPRAEAAETWIALNQRLKRTLGSAISRPAGAECTGIGDQRPIEDMSE